MAVPEKLRGNQHEVHVVGVVADRVDADRACLRDVVLVDLGGRLVGLKRVDVAADAIVDMAGHVDDVPGAWHQCGQSIGVGLGALWAIGGFHEMDVEMDRPRMVGTFRKNAFQALQHIGSPALGLLAARLPIVPGLGVHRRLGRQYRQFEVVRILVRQRRRCVCEGGVERRPFCSRIIRISRGDSLDESLLLVACAGRKRLRLAKRGNRRRVRFGVHRYVDVRSEHQCLAEKAHRASRIEALCLAESAPRFRVVEIDGEPQALVEIALRLRALCADRIAQRAQVVPQRRLGIVVRLHRLGGLRLSGNSGDPAVRRGKITLRRSLRGFSR